MEAIVDDEYRLILKLITKEYDMSLEIHCPDQVHYEDWTTFINCLKSDGEGRLCFMTSDGEAIISTIKGSTTFTVCKSGWTNKIVLTVKLPNSVVKDAICEAVRKLFK